MLELRVRQPAGLPCPAKRAKDVELALVSLVGASLLDGKKALLGGKKLIIDEKKLLLGGKKLLLDANLAGPLRLPPQASTSARAKVALSH